MSDFMPLMQSESVHYKNFAALSLFKTSFKTAQL